MSCNVIDYWTTFGRCQSSKKLCLWHFCVWFLGGKLMGIFSVFSVEININWRLSVWGIVEECWWSEESAFSLWNSTNFRHLGDIVWSEKLYVRSFFEKSKNSISVCVCVFVLYDKFIDKYDISLSHSHTSRIFFSKKKKRNKKFVKKFHARKDGKITRIFPTSEKHKKIFCAWENKKRLENNSNYLAK